MGITHLLWRDSAPMCKHSYLNITIGSRHSQGLRVGIALVLQHPSGWIIKRQPIFAEMLKVSRGNLRKHDRATDHQECGREALAK
jgi:hypothetical protein